MKKRLLSLLLSLVMLLALLPTTARAAGAVYNAYGGVARVIIDGVNYYDIFRTDYYSPIERSDEMIPIFEQALTHYIAKEIHNPSDPRYDSVASNWADVAHGLYLADDENISIDGKDGYSLFERHYRIMTPFITGANTSDVPFYLTDFDPDDPVFADEVSAQAHPGEYWLVNRNSAFSDSGRDGMEALGVFASSDINDLADDIATEIGGFYEDYTRIKFPDRKNIDNYQYITGKSGSDGREELVEKLQDQGLNDEGPFFFTTQSVLAEWDDQGLDSKDDDVQMMTWGAIFYDMSVEYLNIDVDSAVSAIDTTGMTGERELYDYLQEQKSAGNTVPGITYEITTDDPKFSVGGVNQSSLPVDLTIHYGSSVEESATNTYSHSEEYSFTESVSTTSEFKTDGMFGKLSGTEFKWTVSVGFEATQMFNETWENSETYTNISETSTSSTVQLPAHTQILMSTGEGRTAYSMEYDAPIAIRYKVLLFGSYFMQEGNDGDVKGETFKFLGNFGNSALATGENAHGAGSIYNRFHNGRNFESMYGEDLDWTEILDNPWNQDEIYDWGGREIYSVDLAATIDEIYSMQPYTVTGGNFGASVKSTNTTIYGLEPLYPLAKVESDSAFDYDLVVGDELYLDNIPLYGYNDANVPYYGFDPSKGDWRIVDEDGNEVDSDVVSISVNRLTGYTTLEAIGAGEAYVQYFIDEGAYKAANAVNETENINVDRIAIPITVTNEIFENGSIAVDGELVGYVGEEPLAIDSVLSAQIKDAEGKYQDRAIIWELQEIRGAEIVDNRITFTKPGTYHVRAVCGNVKSHTSDPWYEITALDAKELDEITLHVEDPQIQTTASLDLTPMIATATGADQYGNPWEVEGWNDVSDPSSMTDWYYILDGEEFCVADTGLYVDLTPGGHSLVLRCGDAESDELTVQYVSDEPSVTSISPTDVALPYTGGILEFTLTGENLVDGMTVRATDGTTIINASTFGTDTEQIALLEFPANTSSENIQNYTVSVITNHGAQTSVIVSTAPESDEAEELDFAAFRTRFMAASLTLTDNIAINFKTQVTEPEDNTAEYVVGALFWTEEPTAYTILGNPKMQIEQNGANGELYSYDDANNYHVFCYDEIAAKEMNDDLYVVAYVKTGGRYIYSDPLVYSVVKYANTVLNGNYSNEFKTLAVDMLNYGAMAQNYFDYRTDALANSHLTEAQLALGTQEEPTLTNGQKSFGEASKYVRFNSASLSLESYVSLNYKAGVSQMPGYKIDNVQLLYSQAFTDEETWIADRDAGELYQTVMTNNGTAWSGSIHEIVAKGLRDSFYTQVQVTYTNGTDTVTEYSDILQFSVADYAYIARFNGSAALKPLTEALIKYGDSAKAYFATIN